MDYTIFPVDNTPQFLLDRHEKPAKYTVNNKSFYVFGDSDIPMPESDNLTKQGLNHQFKEDNPGLTVAQLKSNVNSRIQQQQSFKLSLAQGRYMWEQEWKQKED